MNKKCVINRLGLSFILSVVFKIGISFVKFNLIINQTLLVVINVICSFIIIIPIWPIIKLILIDDDYNHGNKKILKIITVIWILFLLLGNLILICNSLV